MTVKPERPTVSLPACKTPAGTVGTLTELSPEATLRLAHAVAAQFYAIYYFDLTDGSYACFQRRGHLLQQFGQQPDGSAFWARYIDTYVDPADRDAMRAFTDLSTLGARLTGSGQLSLSYRRTDLGWVRGTFMVTAHSSSGEPEHVIFTAAETGTDFCLRGEAEAAGFAATHDPLTGLLTRSTLDRYLADPHQLPARVGLLLINIDRFKQVNEHYGRATGDKILKRFGDLLHGAFPPPAEAVRLGSDDFAVILPDTGVADWPSLCDIFSALDKALAHCLPDAKPITVSGGLTFSDGGFLRQIYNLADRALSHTRELGCGGCSLIGRDGDITAFRRGENVPEPLLAADDQLLNAAMRALLHNSDAVAYIKNARGEYTAVTERFAVHVTGNGRPADLLGKTCEDVFTDKALTARIAAGESRMFATMESRVTIQLDFTDRNGVQRCHDITKYLLIDSSGHPCGFFGTGFEVTDRALREKEEHLNTSLKIQSALTNLFFAVNYVDIRAGTFELLQGTVYSKNVHRDSRSLEDGIRLFIDNLVAPEFTDKMRAFFDADTLEDRVRGYTHIDCEYLGRHLHNWCRASIIPADRDESGRLTHYLFVVSAIDSDKARDIEAGRSSRHYLDALFNHVPGGVVLFRWDGISNTPLYVSSHFRKLYGSDSPGSEGKPDQARIHPDDLPAFRAKLEEILAHGCTKDIEHVFRAWNNLTGDYRWIKLNAVPEHQPDGSTLIYALYTDVTTEALNEQRSVYASEHDPLTGLRNRRRVFSDARKLLAAHPDRTFAMLRYDIRQFRLYNDFFGEKAGDRLLCDIAELFRKLDPGAADRVYGRIDSDIFVLFFPLEQKKLQRYLGTLLRGLEHYRDDFLVEPAVGIYVADNPSVPVEAMFARASMAAKSIKSGTGRRVATFDSAMEQQISDTQFITNEMQTALEENQFLVYLQPKFALEGETCAGAEALVRWQHPVRGLIPPSVFIPVFESNGFISKLDRYMWEAVCKLLARWHHGGRAVNPVSVNISRISMYNRNTVPFIKALVKRYRVDPALLQFELTESAYMDDPDEMKRMLTELREAGFAILIDDFGSGYSSLNTLRELPADILKLDSGLLPHDTSDVRGWTLIESIIRMSGKLGLCVIAEGVETKAQADFLRTYGCGFAQGYLYAAPMTVPAYEALNGYTPE